MPPRSRTVKKPRVEFAEQLAEYDEAHLTDRVFQHPWEIYDWEEFKKYTILYVFCPRCETRKKLRMDHGTGQRRQVGSYKYGPGYLFTDVGGLWPSEKAALGLELVGRAKQRKEQGTLPVPPPLPLPARLRSVPDDAAS